MFRRIAIRLSTLKEESSIVELRSLLMEQARLKAPPVEVLDTETRLVLLLSQCPGPEDRREALMRAEHVWDLIHSPQSFIPNSSKIGMRVSLCTTLRRCAETLKDQELVELWTSRFDNRRESISMRDFDTHYRPPPPNTAGTSTDGTTSTERQRRLANLIEDEDDDDAGAAAGMSSSGGGGADSKKPVMPESVAPYWRLWGGSKGSKEDPKRKKQQEEADAKEQEAAHKRRMAMSPMQQMREDMMMSDHPMVLGIMKPKQPPGPRWT